MVTEAGASIEERVRSNHKRQNRGRVRMIAGCRKVIHSISLLQFELSKDDVTRELLFLRVKRMAINKAGGIP